MSKLDEISKIIQTYLEGLHNPSDDSLYNELRAMRDTEALKQAIQALIDRERNKAKIEAYEDVINADAMSFRNQLDFVAEDFAYQRIAELSNKENNNE